jgi:hypothetical protein
MKTPEHSDEMLAVDIQRSIDACGRPLSPGDCAKESIDRLRLLNQSDPERFARIFDKYGCRDRYNELISVIFAETEEPVKSGGLPPQFVERFTTTLGKECIDKLGIERRKLSDRIEPKMSVICSDIWENIPAIKSRVLAYRQMALHRASYLFEGTLDAAMNENVYVMVLCMRAHVETTAAVGFLNKRLRSAVKQGISLAQLGEDIAAVVLGSKLAGNGRKIDPKNVMSLIDAADEILRQDLKAKTILRRIYDELCEFAHPNFASNFASFDLGKTNELAVRYGQRMRPLDDSLLQSLLLSNILFCDLFDYIAVELDELTARFLPPPV